MKKDAKQQGVQFVKRFLAWIGVKEKIHFKNTKPPYFKEGEIWWVYIGENVGVEINGKGSKFARPALVYKKLSQHAFLAIPLTTKKKVGTWYVPFTHNKIKQVAVLSQVRILSSSRLDNYIGQISDADFVEIKRGFG